MPKTLEERRAEGFQHYNVPTTLGVPKTADAETIRKAHRKKAKQNHPDAGGQPAAFREINEAYLILRDPARRQRYDQTGEDEQQDTATTDLIGMFIQAVDAIGDTPDGDPVYLVKRKLANAEAQVKGQQREFDKAARRTARMAARIKVAGDQPNLLKLALENHAAGLEQKSQACQIELERIAKMKAIILQYEFEMPKQEAKQGAKLWQWGTVQPGLLEEMLKQGGFEVPAK